MFELPALYEKSPPALPPSLSPCPKAEASKFFHGALTDRVIACAISVHKELGPGFLEAIYEEVFAIELERKQISYARQLPVRIRYQSVSVGMHRIDLIIDKKVVVELKGVREIDDAYLATFLSYLKATNIHVALIIDFAEARTRIRRVLRSPDMTTEKGNGGRQECVLKLPQKYDHACEMDHPEEIT